MKKLIGVLIIWSIIKLLKKELLYAILNGSEESECQNYRLLDSSLSFRMTNIELMPASYHYSISTLQYFSS